MTRVWGVPHRYIRKVTKLNLVSLGSFFLGVIEIFCKSSPHTGVWLNKEATSNFKTSYFNKNILLGQEITKGSCSSSEEDLKLVTIIELFLTTDFNQMKCVQFIIYSVFQISKIAQKIELRPYGSNLGHQCQHYFHNNYKSIFECS